MKNYANWHVLRLAKNLKENMPPEGDAELPDDGLPDELEEGDEEDSCHAVADIFRIRTESL